MWPPQNLCSMQPTHHSNTTIPKSHLSSELSANINNISGIFLAVPPPAPAINCSSCSKDDCQPGVLPEL